MDNFGKSQNLPRSSVRVDKDFWYMHGENGCKDSSSIQGGGRWPNTSIFHNRSSVALRLNPTLSQSVRELDDANDSVAIENLKAVLFRDIRESQEEFFNLCRSDENFCCGNREEVGGGYSCCDCCYAQCNHYNDMLYISQESRYYNDTCPLCVLKVTTKCRRFWNCCITRMKHQK